MKYLERNRDGVVTLHTHNDQDATVLPEAVLKSVSPDYDPIDASLDVVHISEGVYAAAVPKQYTQFDRTFELTWTYDSNEKIDEVEVYSPYSEWEDLLELAPDDATNWQIRDADMFARVLIDSCTSRSFNVSYKTFEVNGTNKDRIVFTPPVVLVDSIKVKDSVLFSQDDDDSPMRVEVSKTHHGIVIVTPVSNRSVVDDISLRKFSSQHKYIVSGLFGYTKVPPAVSAAHKLLFNDWFCTDIAWKKKYIASQSTADWSIRFDGKSYVETGNFYADQLLREFATPRPVVL